MEVNQLAVFWSKAREGLSPVFHKKVSDILAKLPKSYPKVENFDSELKSLGEVANALEGAKGDKSCTPRAKGDLIQMKTVVAGRYAEIEMLRRDLNASIKKIADLGNDFLADETPQKAVAMGTETTALCTLSARRKQQEPALAARQLVILAADIIKKKQSGPKPVNKMLEEIHGRKTQLLKTLAECEKGAKF